MRGSTMHGSSRFAFLLCTLVAPGCLVPAARYEEARSAAQVEQEAQRRTQRELSRAASERDAARAELRTRERRIEKLESELAEAALATDVAGSERRYALELVEQLRGELLRTGDHLREFAGDRNRLADALKSAETRARGLAACEADAADNAGIVRDLAVELHQPIRSGEVDLEVVDGVPLLRIDSQELAGEVPDTTGRTLLAALVRVSQKHAHARVRIREVGKVPDGVDRAKRLRRVSDALAALGLAAERVELAPADEKGSGAPSLELALYAARAADSDAD